MTILTLCNELVICITIVVIYYFYLFFIEKGLMLDCLNKNDTTILTFLIIIFFIAFKTKNTILCIINSLVISAYIIWMTHFLLHIVNYKKFKYLYKRQLKYTNSTGILYIFHMILRYVIYKPILYWFKHINIHHKSSKINKLPINIFNEIFVNFSSVLILVTMICILKVFGYKINLCIKTIIYAGILFSYQHNINQSLIVTDTIHIKHHKNNLTNLSPDFVDILMNTKYDSETESFSRLCIPSILICICMFI